MDILIGAVVFVLLAALVLAIAVCAMMISTAKELTKAIRSINFDKDDDGKESLDKVKFMGPTSSHFGRSPAPKNGMKKGKNNMFIGPKNRKNWGIH